MFYMHNIQCVSLDSPSCISLSCNQNYRGKGFKAENVTSVAFISGYTVSLSCRNPKKHTVRYAYKLIHDSPINRQTNKQIWLEIQSCYCMTYDILDQICDLCIPELHSSVVKHLPLCVLGFHFPDHRDTNLLHWRSR